jgi:hypothetical protein
MSNITVYCDAGFWKIKFDGVGVTITTSIAGNCDPLHLTGFASFLIGSEFPCCPNGSIAITVTE